MDAGVQLAISSVLPWDGAVYSQGGSSLPS